MVSFTAILLGIYGLVGTIVIYALCCADRDADPKSCGGRFNAAIKGFLKFSLRSVPAHLRWLLRTVCFCKVAAPADSSASSSSSSSSSSSGGVAKEPAAAAAAAAAAASRKRRSGGGDGSTEPFGERIWRCGAWCADWTCSKANPLMQLMYLALVLGGVFFFFRDSMPHVHDDNKYLPGGGIHYYTAILAISATLFSFYKASFTDPGRVTPDTVSNMLIAFKYDNMIYTAKHCSTCKIQRPARSKHCGLCGHCVSRFDHHCPWLNNCVGEYNLKWFHAFLLSTSFLCLYEAAVGFAVGLHIVDQRGLFTATYTDRRTGQRLPVPGGMMLQYIMVHSKTLFPLTLFCFVVAIVIFGFWAYHMYLVYCNTTTNETFKWWDYERYVRLWLRRRYETNARHTRRAKRLAAAAMEKGTPESKEESSDGDDYSSDSDSDGDDGDIPPPIYYLDSRNRPSADNIYDGGFGQNLGEMLMPRSKRDRPNAATPKNVHPPAEPPALVPRPRKAGAAAGKKKRNNSSSKKRN